MNALFCYPVLLAQTGEELTRSARSYHSGGVLLAQAACLIFAGLFVYAAYTTAKNGFTITKTSKVTGAPAKVMAAVFLAVAVGIGVFAILFLPKMAF
jgi:TRAP-type C4-dicarboxylate transport system permease small subunit